MLAENLPKKNDIIIKETLASFILKDENYKISYKARFMGLKPRAKVEFLRFFIV